MKKLLLGCAIALSALGLAVYLHHPRLLVEYSKSGKLLPPDPSIRIQPALSQSEVEGTFDENGVFHPVITRGRLGYPYLPDPSLSPGAIMPGVGLDQICVPGYSKTVRHTSGQMKHTIYTEYGVTKHDRGQWEIDHIIPLSWGGADTESNLWAQQAEVNLSGFKAGFHEKDRLELELLHRVCHHEIDLREAQRAIGQDWIQAYQHYIGDLPH